jgi:hypothetical protein
VSILLAAYTALILTAPPQVKSGGSFATSTEMANRKVTSSAGIDFSCDAFRQRLIISGLPKSVTRIQIRSSLFFQKEGDGHMSVPSISPELSSFVSGRAPMRIYVGNLVQIVSPEPKVGTFIRACANAGRKTY